MPTVFVYEYCTALGIGRDPSDPRHSLWREGNAMRSAVVADFERIPGVTVTTMTGVRSSSERAELQRIASGTDAVLIVAPEFDYLLFFRALWALQAVAPGRWLGAAPVTRYATDKRQLARRWRKSGVPTPEPYFLREEPEFPCVVKHVRGAGSLAVRRIESLGDWQALQDAKQLDGVPLEQLLAQPYVPGVAASVSFLVGPNCVVPLLPGFQRLSTDGRFTYLGGEIPMPPGLTLRAVKLARRAIDAVPELAGYVGVDLVLGDADDGSADYAIEINPRLTTSYVGLRALTDDNLMAKLWEVCAGAADVRVQWSDGGVRFTPDGTVTRLA